MDATSVALPDTLAPSLPDGGRGGVAAHLRSLCWTTMFSWTPHREFARSYSGQPALLLRAVDAHHLRRSLSRHAHYAHHRRHQPALFLRAPSPRTTPAPTQASRRLLRFFYAHHRRALYRRPDAPSYVLLPRRSRQALRCHLPPGAFNSPGAFNLLGTLSLYGPC